MKNTQHPGLYGLVNSNRDFTDAFYWGKNQFNSSFPTKAKTCQKALNKFADAGYHLTIAILDASLCGAPQKRKRVVVVGTLKNPDVSIADIYKRMQSDKPMTIRDYLGDSLGIDFYYRHPRSYARRGIFSIDEPSPTMGINQ